MHISPLRQQDVDSSSTLVETIDDDTRCVVTPGVPGVASVISLQLSPAELIRAETVKARHNVPSPVSHRVAVTPGPGHTCPDHTSSMKKLYDIGSNIKDLQLQELFSVSVTSI